MYHVTVNMIITKRHLKENGSREFFQELGLFIHTPQNNNTTPRRPAYAFFLENSGTNFEYS
jgi:hypothetical protein